MTIVFAIHHHSGREFLHALPRWFSSSRGEAMRSRITTVSFRQRSSWLKKRGSRPKPFCRRLAIEPMEGRCLLNAAPLARHDFYETLAGQTLVVGDATSAAPNGVLANDTDTDGDA